MTKIKKLMETDELSVKRQFYPETHVTAVIGLEEFSPDTLVKSVNGKTGNVRLTAEDIAIPQANEEQSGTMSKEMFRFINDMMEASKIQYAKNLVSTEDREDI